MDCPIVLESCHPFEGRLVSVRLDEIRYPDGHQSRQEVVEHRPSMTVIALDGEGRLVLVNQYRHPVGEWMLETPAGSVDEGETVEEAVNRELAEETGLQAHSISYLGSFYLAPGWCTELMHAYLARDLYESPLPGDEDERIEVVRLSPAQWEERIREGRIRDAKSIAAWHLARSVAGVGG